MFRHIANSHARLFQAAAASAVAASVGASASCEVHKVHEEHSLVDVRKRLPTEPHFLHGLAWADGGLELYDTYVGKGSIVSEIRWGQRSGGHHGILHGGAIAASLDDAFGALFFSQGFGPGFTANLTIDYRRPVPVGSHLRIVAKVDKVEGRKVWMVAKLVDSAGPGEDAAVYAEAKCLFIKPRAANPAAQSLPSAYKADSAPRRQ